MNINEVLANRALRTAGRRSGRIALVHPNDEVNKGNPPTMFPNGDAVSAVLALRSACFRVGKAEATLAARPLRL